MKYNLFILPMALISMSAIFLLSGCCSMPLVDCGPRIMKVQISPEYTTFTIGDVNYTLTFQASNYYDRRSKNFIQGHITVLLHDTVEFIFDESDIYYFQGGEKIYPAQKNYYSFGNFYSVSFSDCLQPPGQIYFNGIKVDQSERKLNFVINLVDDVPTGKFSKNKKNR
mgnify:CR=1 FL=1